jgi:septal ring-binding cell division protein DamX
VELQILMWDLGERIPIEPQIWDADTPQVGVGAADDDVDIVTLDDLETTPAVPEPPKKSPKEKRRKKRKKAAQQESDGRLVIRLKKAGSAKPADAAEDEGRPGGTAENFYPETINSAADDIVLATDLASVQLPGGPVLVTEEVRPTDGAEPVGETVDAPTPMIEDQAPKEHAARDPTDTERETIPVSPPSSPVSKEASKCAANSRQISGKIQ